MIDSDSKNSSPQELFGDFNKSKKKGSFLGFRKKMMFPQHRFTVVFTHEKLLLIVIILIVIVIISFSLGVEKGKHFAILDTRIKEDQYSIAAVNPPKKQLQQKTTPTIVTQKILTKEVAPVLINKKNQTSSKAQVSLGGYEEINASANVNIRPTVDNPYLIQLVTYVKKDSAQKEVAILRSKGYGAFIIPSGEFLQVCIGPYTTKQDALKDLSKFKKNKSYKDCFIKKEK